MNTPYIVEPPPGKLGGVESTIACRYAPRIEAQLLEAGYSIFIGGKRLTKADVNKLLRSKAQRPVKEVRRR